MAGFTDILGALVKSGLSKSSSSRATKALSGGGSLNDIVGSIGKMLGDKKKKGQPDIGGMLGDVLGSLGSNKAALGGLGALGGALLGGGMKSAKGAIGGGALAMLASLAFSALKKSGKKPVHEPRALMEPVTEQDKQELEDDANIIVKAMINAAKADGAIDNQELQNIMGKMEEDGLTQGEKDLFMSEATKPLDLERVIASAGGRADMAAQIYAATYLAIEVDTAKEKQYVKNLAKGLNLEDQTTDYLKASLGAV